MNLAAVGWTNGQFQLTFGGEAGINYFIESSPDLVSWTPVATNNETSASRIVTLVAPNEVNFYRIARDPIPVFAYALGAVSNILLNGNGISVDSWNSHDPSQSANGYYNAYSGSNGNVALTFGNLSLANSIIKGSLYLGPTSTNTSSANQVTGLIYTNANIDFPDVALPNVGWLLAPTTNYVVNGKTVSIHDFTMGGNYLIGDSSSIVVEAGVTVTLQVTITNFMPLSVTINGGTTNSGTIVVYQDSGYASFVGNSFGGPIGNRPENFIYFGLPGVTNITLSSIAAFVGAIYSPEAVLVLNGGGSPNDFIGSSIIHDIILNGHYPIHFDESLLTVGPYR